MADSAHIRGGHTGSCQPLPCVPPQRSASAQKAPAEPNVLHSVWPSVSSAFPRFLCASGSERDSLVLHRSGPSVAGSRNGRCRVPSEAGLRRSLYRSLYPRTAPLRPQRRAALRCSSALPSHMHRKLVTEANGPACGHQRADNSSLSKGPFMSQPPTRPVRLKSPFVCPCVRACRSSAAAAGPTLRP